MDSIDEQSSDDEMVFRYRNADGLTGGGGAFPPARSGSSSVWRGRTHQGSGAQYGNGIRYANHLGLFFEELARRGMPLGNFPQALTHLAFISAAYFLDRRLSPRGPGLWQP